MLRKYCNNHKIEIPILMNIPRGYLESICYGKSRYGDNFRVSTCAYKDLKECPGECSLKEIKVKPSRLERFLMKYRNECK